MKRLLVLLPAAPDPPDSGAKLRNLSLLRLAAERFQVDTLAYERPSPRSATTRALQQARTELPDLVLRYASDAFATRVRCALAGNEYDAVQAEGIEMAQYLGLVAPERRVYDAHNAEFLLQRRASESAPNALGRLYSRLQWQRLQRFERHVVRRSRLVMAVSQHDANQLLALVDGQARVEVVPSAIDIDAFPFRLPDDRPNLLFLGKLDYRPNAEALGWFLDAVLPRLNGVRLFVVGGHPPDWLVRAGQHDARVAVTGYVADERPYLQRCNALLLPMRAAGGSRLKALVAMASGVPIVSTALGMEGLEAEPDVHYLRAQAVEEWVTALTRLMGKPEMRTDLARRARALVEQHYDWRAIRPALAAAYAELET